MSVKSSKFLDFIIIRKLENILPGITAIIAWGELKNITPEMISMSLLGEGNNDIKSLTT